MVVSCGGSKLWPCCGVAVDMAGWVGDGLGEAGAVAACKGGAFTAAGPVSDVCASVVRPA